MVNTEFDKLRKRVYYLNYDKRKRSIEPNDVHPSQQIHSDFIDEIHEIKSKTRLENQQLGINNNSDTESDDSIREIKENHRKNVKKIDLMNLTDK